MTGARYFAKQRERARLAALRQATADAVNAAVGKRWLDEGADAPEAEPCVNCGAPGGATPCPGTCGGMLCAACTGRGCEF